MENRTKRQDIDKSKSALESDRSPFMSVYRELADNFSPSRIQHLSTRGQAFKTRLNSHILDTTPVQAVQTLRAGMTGGITSPARPWFSYTTLDPELAEWGPVKDWLWETRLIIAATMNRGNFYGTVPNLFQDSAVYGTSVMGVFERMDDYVLHHECYEVGSYVIGQDHYGRVDKFARDFVMTVGQLVKRFGNKNASDPWENFSLKVRQAYERGDYEQSVDVSMWCGPNEDYVPGSPWSLKKKFICAYYEKGIGGAPSYTKGEEQKMLMEKGYGYFPVLGLRWERSDSVALGVNCPGMITLGDAKRLQLGTRRIYEAAEKMLRPAMMAPTSLRGKENFQVPGSTTFVDIREGMQGLKSVYDLNFDINQMAMINQESKRSIERGFFADLFLMLSNMEQRERTAYEIAERKEEKLLALGPVLEQTNFDFADPYLDMQFEAHLRRGLLPPIPEELRGQDLKIEYTSVTAQAQKLIGISAIDRFVSSVAQIAQFDPKAVRKIKSYDLVDEYGTVLSVNPSIMRTTEELEAMDADEAQQIRQQQQMQMVQQGSQAARNLAQSPTDGDNALNELMSIAQAGG